MAEDPAGKENHIGRPLFQNAKHPIGKKKVSRRAERTSHFERQEDYIFFQEKTNQLKAEKKAT